MKRKVVKVYEYFSKKPITATEVATIEREYQILRVENNCITYTELPRKARKKSS